MVTFSGLKNSDRVGRPNDKVCETNSRKEDITTEGIVEGMKRVNSLFGDDYTNNIKSSGLFLRESIKNG